MNASVKSMLIGGLTGCAGVIAWCAGFVLQINLLGHGPFTAINYLGVVLMLAGPGAIIWGGRKAKNQAPSTFLKIIFFMEIGAGAFLLAVTLLAILNGQYQEFRRHKLRNLQQAELYSCVAVFNTATEKERRGDWGVFIIGRYEAAQGTLIDGFIIGPPEKCDINDITVSSGAIRRFTWVRPNDVKQPLIALAIQKPPAEFIEKFKDNPAYQDIINPPPPPSPQPVRRFLFLLTDSAAPVVLKSPYGDTQLPEPSKQPLNVVCNPNFRDQRTLRNRILLF